MILYRAKFEAEDCNDTVWDIIQEIIYTHPNVEFSYLNYLDGDCMELNFGLTLKGKEKENEEVHTSEENP